MFTAKSGFVYCRAGVIVCVIMLTKLFITLDTQHTARDIAHTTSQHTYLEEKNAFPSSLSREALTFFGVSN